MVPPPHGSFSMVGGGPVSRDRERETIDGQARARIMFAWPSMAIHGESPINREDKEKKTSLYLAVGPSKHNFGSNLSSTRIIVGWIQAWKKKETKNFDCQSRILQWL